MKKCQPICLCGEDSEHSRPVVNLQYIGERLENIKVEKRITRNRTVQPSFKKWCPVTFQHPRGAPIVVLTNTCNPWENHLRGQEWKSFIIITLRRSRHRILNSSRECALHVDFEQKLQQAHNKFVECLLWNEYLTFPRVVYSTAISLKKKYT